MLCLLVTWVIGSKWGCGLLKYHKCSCHECSLLGRIILPRGCCVTTGLSEMMKKWPLCYTLLHYVAATLCLTCHLSKNIKNNTTTPLSCQGWHLYFCSVLQLGRCRHCYCQGQNLLVIPPHMCNTAKPLFLLRAVVTLSVSLSKTQRSIELFCDNLVVSLFTFNSKASTA